MAALCLKQQGLTFFFKSQHGQSAAFAIVHYAGEVVYEAAEFVDTNREHFGPGLLAVRHTPLFRLVKVLFCSLLNCGVTLFRPFEPPDTLISWICSRMRRHSMRQIPVAR